MEFSHKTQTDQVSPNLVYQSSVVSFVCFVGMFATMAILPTFPNLIYLSTYFSVAFHLALLPIVVFMPSPSWTKIGGYTWVAMDVILAVAALNGTPNSTIEPIRFGVHVMLVLWPIGLAMSNSGFLKWTSIGFAATTGIAPLLGDLATPELHFISLPFIFLWYVAVILNLKKIVT